VAVDLHLHSSISDGTDSPERIVDLAVAAGLSGIALTDHDTFEGIAEAREAAGERIEFVPGVEMSVDWAHTSMHLLAYFVGPGSQLDHELSAVRASRVSRNAEMIVALNDMGIPVTLSEVEQISGHGVLGRPHIAEALVNHGVVDSIPEAFDQYLARGRPAYRSRLRFDATRAVALVAQAGGVTSVAHPHTVADDAAGFGRALDGFVADGIDGVECWYSEYGQDQRVRMARGAGARGLIATGGSDYHGHRKPDIAVGVGKGDLRVPDEALTALLERHATRS
jgi:predicted metal-dependent phosphoesterase TrpH